jgi:hypothetical protein
MALRAHFHEHWNQQDTEEAIATMRRILDLTPDGHLNKPRFFNDLGLDLLVRFRLSDNLVDVEEVLACERSAVDLMPDSDPVGFFFFSFFFLSILAWLESPTFVAFPATPTS